MCTSFLFKLLFKLKKKKIESFIFHQIVVFKNVLRWLSLMAKFKRTQQLELFVAGTEYNIFVDEKKGRNVREISKGKDS